MRSRDRRAAFAGILLRLALAGSYLSAVADRFGIWGPPGTPNVVWGGWEPFMAYVSTLNWFVPASLHPALGWGATVAEVVIAIGLILGWRLQWFALASGGLLLIFAGTMSSAFGVKPPLDYSVFTAAAASFVLAAQVGRPRLPLPARDRHP